MKKYFILILYLGLCFNGIAQTTITNDQLVHALNNKHWQLTDKTETTQTYKLLTVKKCATSIPSNIQKIKQFGNRKGKWYVQWNEKDYIQYFEVKTCTPTLLILKNVKAQKVENITWRKPLLKEKTITHKPKEINCQKIKPFYQNKIIRSQEDLNTFLKDFFGRKSCLQEQNIDFNKYAVLFLSLKLSSADTKFANPILEMEHTTLNISLEMIKKGHIRGIGFYRKIYLIDKNTTNFKVKMIKRQIIEESEETFD